MLHFNPFVLRQTADSRFGHYAGTMPELVALTTTWFQGAKPGYRDGVLVVPVPPAGFYSSVVPLFVGMTLTANFTSRRPGEAPRLSVGAVVPDADYRSAKVPAVAVDIIVYASTVLAESKDETLPPVAGNWEIVSINPRMCVEDEPIQPETLMANHLRESGGTATGMTDAEFVEALRVSRAYWTRHVMLA